MYQIQRFLFRANGSILTLDLSSSVVLVHKNFSTYMTGRLLDLHSCSTEHLSLYFCSASIFAFLPLAGAVCEVFLRLCPLVPTVS